MSGGTNEALVLDALSLLDDIEVLKAHTGGAAAADYRRPERLPASREIRGLPVEDRIVTPPG